MSEPKLVVCETSATITTHLRDTTHVPTNDATLSGFTVRPLTLCGVQAGWDTRLPLESARCKTCRAKAYDHLISRSAP